MTDCAVPGWGLSSWGVTPWGGVTGASAGGPLPTVAPFDLYCVGPCGPMAEFLTHPEVSGTGLFSVDGGSQDLVLSSGGSQSAIDTFFTVSTSVPTTWTLEFTAKFNALPVNFTDLMNRHVFVGASDAQGNSAGLFISQVGLLYTGAVHIDGAGNLVLDSPVQALPDSQLLISLDEYYTFQIATSFDSGSTYIYVTKTSELGTTGQQLRYVLPAIPSSTCLLVPPDQTQMSVRGNLAEPAEVQLDTICLGTGLIIPNLPPQADAGIDQAVRTCSVARFDGTKSYDPEGATLQYAWRLLDAPNGSQYVFGSTDGNTFPLSFPTGFTNKFYSASLGTLNTQTPILPLDVLLVDGIPYNVISTGTDGTGFYALIDGYDLPDDLSGEPFRFLRQHGISGRTTAQPTFYPDVAGLYRFDLIVFDGNLFSLPAVTVLNVTESPLPRGCTPDLSFLWNYLSDFWRLVDNTDRIEVFWGGVAQIAAAELLNLWQIDYSKSLQDIQRTFRRKWLRYALNMQEDPLFFESTTVRAVYGGVESTDIPTAGSAVGGQWIDLVIKQGTVNRITISGSGLILADSIKNQILGQLQGLSQAFSVETITSTDGTRSRVRIDAPFAFSLASSSTLSIFPGTPANAIPQGTSGARVGTLSYKVERSLQDTGVQAGDFLVVDSTAYQIVRIISDPSDDYPLQRVVTTSDIPLAVSTTWAISGQVTSPTLDFWNGFVSNGDLVTIEILSSANGVLSYLTVPALGACASAPGALALDTTNLGVYLYQGLYEVFFTQVMRRQYIPVDPLVVDVPYLQEIINNTDDTQVLRRNVDYFLETFRGGPCIRFVVGSNDVWQGGAPPDHLWAENTYLDNRPLIEANFGVPAEFTLDDLAQLPDNVDYLSAVRGLWYAYFNGPTLFNLRVGTQILLGLPFAEENGVITEIRSDFSTTNGRILVQDTANQEIIRSYSYPASLKLEVNPATKLPYVIGDGVSQFAPLVQGTQVIDWIKQPNWFEGYLHQGAFFEVEKFFKFLVLVDSAAFNLSALLFVKTFILNIKPTYTYPLFVVSVDISDESEISVTDETTMSGTLILVAGPCFENSLGIAQMFDQPNCAGGGWTSHWDVKAQPAPPAVLPTYPTPDLPTTWVYDREILCPEDAILCTLTTVFGAPAIPTFDSIFQWDVPVATKQFAAFEERGIWFLYAGQDFQVGDAFTATATGTVTGMTAIVDGFPATGPFDFIVKKNGTTVITQSFTKTGPGAEEFPFTVSVTVTSGDVLEAFVASAIDADIRWAAVMMALETAVYWAYDTELAAATYYSYRSL